MAFEQALATWLVEQRWFAGKGHSLRDLAIVADTEIVPGDPELRHMIITVSHGMTVDYYQVLVGFRRKLPERLSHALIGATGDGRIAYDALHDADLTKPLLDGFARQSSIGGIHLFTVAGARFSTGLDSLVLTTEQTNTSLVYGDESILKVFRRLFPGPNPDLEVNTALAVLGSAHVAEPLGWAEARLEGVPTVLAILSRYLRLASDGWSLAATSVRDLYALADRGTAGVDANDAGGDFAGEARRLGAATAQVHADLATAFGTDELPTRAIGDLTEQMFRKLDLTVSAVPELAKYADMIGGAYSQLAKVSGPFPVQRVHGDYHLGQVLRTENGWVVLDFEGEPRHPAGTSPGTVLPAARCRGDAALLRLRRPPSAARLPDAARP